jgi:uncharacterized protein (DUF2384 family)
MKTWIPAQKPADNALWRYAGLPANRGMRLIELLSQGLPVTVLDNIHEKKTTARKTPRRTMT